MPSHDVSNSTTFLLRNRFSKVYLIYLHGLGIPHAFPFSFLWKSVSPSVLSLISSSLIVSCVGTQGTYQVVLSFSLWKLFFLCPTTPKNRKEAASNRISTPDGNPWTAEVSLGAFRSPDLNFTTFQLWTFAVFVDNPGGYHCGCVIYREIITMRTLNEFIKFPTQGIWATYPSRK